MINGARTGGTGTSYTASDLLPRTSYYFKVYSVTSANIQGINANRLIAQTDGPCECVSKVLTIAINSSIFLTGILQRGEKHAGK